MLADVLVVGAFDVALVDHSVLHGGVDLGVAEEALHLLDGHALVDGSGGEGAAKLVGVDLAHSQLTPKGAQATFYAADFQPLVGSQE